MDNFRWLVLEQSRGVLEKGLANAIAEGKIRHVLRAGEFYLLGLIIPSTPELLKVVHVLCIGSTVVGHYDPSPADKPVGIETLRLASDFVDTSSILKVSRHPFNNAIWLYSNNIDKQWELFGTGSKPPTKYYIDINSVISL